MILAVDTQRLLALHYVYPLPLQKLQRLLSPVNVLNTFEEAHYDEIANVLQISAHKALQISQSFRQIMTIPFEEYSMHGPIFSPYLFIILISRRNYLKYPVLLLYCM
ncbi:hypothetical protein AABM34_05280 [Lysinibacillus fusiformis]